MRIRRVQSKGGLGLTTLPGSPRQADGDRAPRGRSEPPKGRAVGHQAQQGLRGSNRWRPPCESHDTSSSEGAPVRDGPIEAAAKRAGRFGVHVLEMCVVMCVGLGVLGALFLGASAVLGLPDDVRQQVPELSALIVAAVLALSMVVWMRFRGTEWRPTLEMAGAAIAAGVVMIAGYWLGIVAENDLVQSVCGGHALP